MVLLSIYIAKHCPVSHYSVALARDVADAFPEVDVRVIDVDDKAESGGGKLRDHVLFTPGYFLDGRLISWGNPRRNDLFALVARALDRNAERDSL